MYPVLLAQWMKERRSPYLLLLFIGLSVLAVVLFGMNEQAMLKVDVFADSGISEAEASEWVEHFNASDAIVFGLSGEEEARNNVREGRSSAAIRLMGDDYRIVASTDEQSVQLVEQQVRVLFLEELQLRKAAMQADDPGRFRDNVEARLASPSLDLRISAADGGDLSSYDMGIQLMFTFTLFLAMMTIGFKVNAVNAEKTSGIWDRMILSPTNKTQMYMGHLLYSAAAGFLQVLIVYLIFLYGFRFEIGERFGLLLLISALFVVAAVAMAMLIVGLTRTPEHFYMIYPSVVPIMPLVSGGYMPPGTITNDILLLVAEIIPIKHALDASIGVVIFDAGWADLYLPLAKLLLLAVLCMGVGINLVERKRS